MNDVERVSGVVERGMMQAWKNPSGKLTVDLERLEVSTFPGDYFY